MLPDDLPICSCPRNVVQDDVGIPAFFGDMKALYLAEI